MGHLFGAFGEALAWHISRSSAHERIGTFLPSAVGEGQDTILVSATPAHRGTTVGMFAQVFAQGWDIMGHEEARK